MNVVDVLARSPGRADAIALATPGGVWTYARLFEAVDARAAELREAAGTAPAARAEVEGVAPWVVPTVVAPDVPSIVELLALWREGAVPAPLNARLTDAERARARQGLDSGPAPEGSQVVLWTSGTSGRPRGVALSWANLEAITRASEARLGLSGNDVWVASLSPAHVGGLVLIVRSLLLGGALVVPGTVDAEALSELLDHGLPGRGDGRSDPSHPADSTGGDAASHGSVVPTHLSLVPTQLHRILDIRGERGAPAGLRCALIGGAHAPASLVARALEAQWPVALTYGATEMSSQVATAPPELVRAKPGTVGAPMPGVEISVAPGGELLARGRTLALGCLGGDVPALTDGSGWYHTGDLGRMDEDGHLWITGRRIDRIVSGGVTIDAVEVEEAIRAHPEVADVCVVGVPDAEWGQRVAAWVEPVSGTRRSAGPTAPTLTAETLTGHLRDRVTGAKVPRLWHVSPGLPRNANGKADRAAVLAVLSGSRSTTRA